MSHDRFSNTDIDSSPDRDQYRSEEDHLSVDEIHRLLANERRRVLLSCLMARSDDSVSVDALVDVIADHEAPDLGPATHCVRIETDLHHVHLPKLADAEVVDYDPVAATVTYEGSELLESILSATNTVEQRDE